MLPVPYQQMFAGGTKGFSAFPWLAYGCYDPCPDGQSALIGPYVPFPFTPFWKVATSPFIVVNDDKNHGKGRIRATSGTGLINVCPPEDIPGSCKPWWVVKAFGFDQIVQESEGEFDFPSSEAITSGQAFTMLKMQVRGFEYGRYRSIVTFDIGSRMDISFGPAQRLEADILIPDVERYINEGFVVPEPFDDTNFAAKSKIIPSAVIGEPIGHSTGRYTQSIFLRDPDQLSFTMDIPNGAKRVQIFVDNTTAAAPSIQFILPIVTATEVVVGTAVVGPDTEGDHEIPDNAKQIRATIAGGAPQRIVTYVFDLEM